MKFRTLILCVLLIKFSTLAASPLMVPLFTSQNTYICNNVDISSGRPVVSDEDCTSTKIHAVDPQNKELWLRVDAAIDVDALPVAKPLGIYLFAKTSSRIYFNGHLIGENGQPAKKADDEQVGLMDTAFYLDDSLIKAGNNQILIQLSSHHGLMKLSIPVHYIGLGTYGDAKDFIQQNNQLALVLLGVLLIGSVYFSTLCINPYQRSTALPLAIMSILTSAQLFAEASRG